MKILGLSFGRKMKNCDILVKHALMKAKEEGADIKFVNTVGMKIDRCIGCGACSAGRDKGKQIRCIIKDDYQEVEEAVLEADGIIVAAPVYSLAPVGQFKNFIDRFGAAHDIAAAKAEQDRRIQKGDVELLDPRLFKNKYVAYISVGGAITQNWVSLGLPNMAPFGMSTLMKVVGQYDAYDMGRTANPLLDEKLLAGIAVLGKHLVDSIGKPFDEVEWQGDEGTCPVCHNNMITIRKGKTVECPICGIEGVLAVDGGEINVSFSEEQQNRARTATFEGLQEHYLEIKDMMDVAIPKIMANKELLDEKMKKYKKLESTY